MPEIWDEFKTRFGIHRVAEFYGASEGNIAFVNALNVDRTAGICPLPYAVVEYDEDSGSPRAATPTAGCARCRAGEVGLLLAKVTDRAPFDGYTDEEATDEKLVRDGFDDGDCWFDTGDLVRRQGWCARRVRRPARRHVPLEGRERRDHRGRGRAPRASRRSSTPSSTASRSPGPTVARGWPR